MTDTEAPVREGDILAGKYRVEKVLGVGGMGVVVSATHTELEQRVALKFLLPDAAKNKEVVERFSREARAAAKIKSEHVVRVSDVGTMDTGTPYIVMEFLEGIDLADYMEQRGALSTNVAVDYILQACEALAEAHAAQIVHRDLKPANLFLAKQADGGEIIKVLDFGISKSIGAPGSAKSEASLTKTTDVFGSPMYMSPEQLRSSRDVDARADIWALGVILFELLTTKAPFDRGTVAEIFGAILHEPPPDLAASGKDLPAGLASVVARCLEKDAKARFANVGDLAKALLPYASTGAERYAQRAARVLRRAGVTVASVPPPAGSDAAPFSLGPSSIPKIEDPSTSVTGPSPVAAKTQASQPSPGASTRTSWGEADGVPKARSNLKTVFAAVLTAGLLVGGYVGFTRYGAALGLKPPPSAAQTPVQTAVRDTAPPPAPSPSPAPPPVTASVAAPAPAPVFSGGAASASAKPAASAPVVTVGPAAKPPPSGKVGPKATSHVTISDALPPPAPAPAPAPAPKPAPDDPEGFGERK